MRDFLEKIDDALFDVVFQPFCHWFQMMIGVNNFLLVRIMVVANYAIQLVYDFLTDKMVFMVIIVNGLITIFAVYSISVFEKTNGTKSISGSATMNWGRKNPMVSSIREFFIFYIIYSIVRWVIADGISSRVLATRLTDLCQIYIVCCTPLPPREEGSVRDLVSEPI